MSKSNANTMIRRPGMMIRKKIKNKFSHHWKNNIEILLIFFHRFIFIYLFPLVPQ